MGVAESTVHNEQPYYWPFQDAMTAKEEVRRSSLGSEKVDVLIIGAGPSGLEYPCSTHAVRHKDNADKYSAA